MHRGIICACTDPQSIITRVATEFTMSLRDERIIGQLTDLQQIAIDLSGPDKLRTFLREQMSLWGPIAREQGLKAEE